MIRRIPWGRRLRLRALSGDAPHLHFHVPLAPSPILRECDFRAKRHGARLCARALPSPIFGRAFMSAAAVGARVRPNHHGFRRSRCPRCPIHANGARTPRASHPIRVAMPTPARRSAGTLAPPLRSRAHTESFVARVARGLMHAHAGQDPDRLRGHRLPPHPDRPRRHRRRRRRRVAPPAGDGRPAAPPPGHDAGEVRNRRPRVRGERAGTGSIDSVSRRSMKSTIRIVAHPMRGEGEPSEASPPSHLAGAVVLKGLYSMDHPRVGNPWHAVGFFLGRRLFPWVVPWVPCAALRGRLCAFGPVSTRWWVRMCGSVCHAGHTTIRDTHLMAPFILLFKFKSSPLLLLL